MVAYYHLARADARNPIPHSLPHHVCLAELSHSVERRKEGQRLWVGFYGEKKFIERYIRGLIHLGGCADFLLPFDKANLKKAGDRKIYFYPTKPNIPLTAAFVVCSFARQTTESPSTLSLLEEAILTYGSRVLPAIWLSHVFGKSRQESYHRVSLGGHSVVPSSDLTLKIIADSKNWHKRTNRFVNLTINKQKIDPNGPARHPNLNVVVLNKTRTSFSRMFYVSGDQGKRGHIAAQLLRKYQGKAVHQAFPKTSDFKTPKAYVQLTLANLHREMGYKVPVKLQEALND